MGDSRHCERNDGCRTFPVVKKKKSLRVGGFNLLSRGGHAKASPLRLDRPLFFYPWPRPTDCKDKQFFPTRNINKVKKH